MAPPINRPLFPLLVIVLTFSPTILVRAEVFGGIEFPQGPVSFADRVVSFIAGAPGPTHPLFLDSSDALGPPNYAGGDRDAGAVALGRGGVLVLEFTNNLLTGSNSPAKDIHVFEVGSDIEDTFVEISPDGVTWHSIGKVFGSTSSIDIDSFGFTASDRFRFVRLTDDPNEGDVTGDTVGADIDAVGAIATSSVNDDPILDITDGGNAAYSSTVLGQNPVVYYRLGELSGRVAVNAGSAGSSAAGIYGVNSQLGRPGLRTGSTDTAVRFASKSTLSHVLTPSFPMPVAAVTVSFLIRGDDDGSSALFGYAAGTRDNELVMLSDNGQLVSYVRGSAATVTGVDLLDGTIHHFALTLQSTTGVTQFFVDGLLRGSRIAFPGLDLATNGILALAQDIDNFTAPTYGFDAAQSLVGTLDEFAVFGRVLSAAEIAAQHSAAVAPPTSNDRELFLQFDSAFGSFYSIRTSTNLMSWQDFLTGIAGTGGTFRTAVKPTDLRRFYRLE